jgi:REP element-mobilizing transposase RayT
MRLPHVIPFRKSPVYFFTACVHSRHRVLANRNAFDVLSEIWERSGSVDGWYVGNFFLMPDHVHFFATPIVTAKTREAWTKMWKSVSARRLLKELNCSPPFWQGDTFDHVLRGNESYAEKWKHVKQNPVRAGLCSSPEEWPWQGEITQLKFEDG